MANHLKLIESQIKGCIPYTANILTSERNDKGINIMGLPYLNLHMIRILEESGRQWRVKSDATTDCVHLEICNDDHVFREDYVILENDEPSATNTVSAIGMSFTTEEYIVKKVSRTGDTMSIGNNLTITRGMFDDFIVKHNTMRQQSSETLPAISNCVIQGYKLIVTRPRKTTSKQPSNKLLKRRAHFNVFSKRINHISSRKRLRAMRAARSKAKHAQNNVPA